MKIKSPLGFYKVYKSLNTFFMVENNSSKIVVDEVSDLYSIRRHQERRAILTPILTDFSVRVTAAPAIIFSKNLSPDSGQTEVSIHSALHEILRMNYFCREYSDFLNENVSAL